MTAVIEGTGVVKIYGDPKEASAKRAVDDVSFRIKAGELFVIMGLSGSGKSTLLRMMNRLIEPSSGEITINGESLVSMGSKRLHEVRNNTINMVFQHFAVFPHRTVLDNASYGLKVRGVSKKEREARATESLEIVGLREWADNFPSDLSGGMRQRVGLARALATDSQILLMDEPFSALDPLIRHDMQDLLLHLQDELKKTIVFVTHDLNEAMRLGDRIMVMRDGMVVQLGTAEAILNSPVDDYVADFVANVDRSRVITAGMACEPPRLLLTHEQSQGEVAIALREHRMDAAYVLDYEGRVLGIVRRSALDADKAGTGLDRVITQDYAAVRDRAKIGDCFDLVGGHSVPLGVIDENDKLVGVLPRATLLATLSRRGKADANS